jgi:hypothetical protein
MPPFGGQIKFTPGPDKKKSEGHDADPADQKEHAGEEHGKGDGFHHHEIHEHESGLHSKHTHPDGQEEHADHGDYDEAKAEMDRHFGQQDLGRNDGDQASMADDDADDMPDFSGAYSRG